MWPVSVIREAFGRTWLEQTTAHCGDPGAVLPPVCGDPSRCVCCAGPPLCLQPGPQAGPRGASRRPDVDVAWQMSQRPDLWHEHLWLWIRWDLQHFSMTFNYCLQPWSLLLIVLLCFYCRSAAAGPEDNSTHHCPARDHWEGSIRWGVAGEMARRGCGSEDFLLQGREVLVPWSRDLSDYHA